MTHQIRLATVNDAKELLAIYAPYVENTTITFEYEVPSLEEFTGRIKKISATYPYLVYMIGDEIAGYAYASTYRSRAAFMWDVETSVYIKESYHHKNIAAKLYRVLFTLLKEQGFYTVYAYISVPNPKSTRFHEKFDFKEIAVYKNTGFKLGTWCDLSCMVKELLPIEENTAPLPYKKLSELDGEFVDSVLTDIN